MPRAKLETPKVTVTTAIDFPMLDRVDRVAARLKISRHKALRHAIERGLFELENLAT